MIAIVASYRMIISSARFIAFGLLGIIGMEYWRQTANAAKKEHKQDTNLVELRKDINSLSGTLQKQREQIDQLTALVASLDRKGYKLVPADRETDRKALKPR